MRRRRKCMLRGGFGLNRSPRPGPSRAGPLGCEARGPEPAGISCHSIGRKLHGSLRPIISLVLSHGVGTISHAIGAQISVRFVLRFHWSKPAMTCSFPHGPVDLAFSALVGPSYPLIQPGTRWDREDTRETHRGWKATKPVSTRCEPHAAPLRRLPRRRARADAPPWRCPRCRGC